MAPRMQQRVLLLLAAVLAALLALGADSVRAANCTTRAYAAADALVLSVDPTAGVTNVCFVLAGGELHGMSHVIVYVTTAALVTGEYLVVRDATGSTVMSVPVDVGSSYHVLVASNATLEMNGTAAAAYVGWQWIASSNLSVGLPRVGESTATANLFNLKAQQVLYFFLPTPSGTADVQLNSYYGDSGFDFNVLLFDPTTIFTQTLVSEDYSTFGDGSLQQVVRVTGLPTRGAVVAAFADYGANVTGMSMVSGAAQCSSPTFTNSSGSFTDGSDYWSYASSCSFTIAPTDATLFEVNLTRVDLDPSTSVTIRAGPSTYGPYSSTTLPSSFFVIASSATFTLASTFSASSATFDGINGTYAAQHNSPPGLLSAVGSITQTLSPGSGPLIAVVETGTSTSITLQFVVTASSGVVAGLMRVLVRHFALPGASGIYDYRILHANFVTESTDFSFSSVSSDAKTVTAALTGLVANSLYYIQVERGSLTSPAFDVTVSIFTSTTASSLAGTIGASAGASIAVIIIVVGGVTGFRRARRRRMRAHPLAQAAPEPMQVVFTDHGYFAVPVSQIDNRTMSPLGQFSTSNLLSPDVSISMMQSLRANSLRLPGLPVPSVSVEEADEESMPDVVVTHWQKGSLLGRGGFGRVYMGLNLDTGEIIAVKQIQIGGLDGMSNDDYQMVRQEVNLMRQLKHKNIVRYLGCERTEEDLNIFLEFVPGGSLATIISRFGHLSEDVIKVYCREILQGLRYLHNKGVIHRDIKGANILVGRNSCCKLADFGASRELEGMMSRASIKGTPYFMAPEVIQQRRTTSAADIWSFGCTVIEMATGRPPFADSVNQIAVMFAITSGTEAIPIPENLSPAGRDFVQICLNRNAEARPTADDLLHHPFLAEITDSAQASHMLGSGLAGAQPASGQHSGHFSSSDALPEQPPPPVASSSLDGPRRLGRFDARDDRDDDDGESESGRPAKGDAAESSSFSSSTNDDDAAADDADAAAADDRADQGDAARGDAAESSSFSSSTNDDDADDDADDAHRVASLPRAAPAPALAAPMSRFEALLRA